MPQEIKIRYAGDTYATHTFTFPGGEIQVQIPSLPTRLTGDVTLLARLQSVDAILRLLLTTEVLYRAHRTGWKRLIVPNRKRGHCARQSLG